MEPLLEDFRLRHEPSEARLLGAPIDHIFFENMDSDADKPVTITLTDAKMGRSPLSRKQRRIGRPSSGSGSGGM